MEHAWLESLSEDWPSQPRSDDSQAVVLPATNPTLASQKGCRDFSRIPLSSSRRQSSPTHCDNTPLPLNERSLSDKNIPALQQASGRFSKPKQAVLSDAQSPQGSGVVDSSISSSVRQHTVQHKSLRTSPKKSKNGQNTPEWKRRLLQGEVAYGEQRDLFSPAGLENIFRPPPSQNAPSYTAPKERDIEDITLPSSPPLRQSGSRLPNKCASTADLAEEDGVVGPKDLRTIKYTMIDADSQQFSEDSLSRSSSFHPTFSALEKLPIEIRQSFVPGKASGQPELTLEPQNCVEAIRVLSGRSDVRHEGLSPIYVSRHNTVDGRIDYSALDLPAAELQQRLENFTTNDSIQPSNSDERRSQALLEHDTSETEGFTQIGDFVNLGRGGKSEDGSFQQRMLSPSSLPLLDESALLSEASVEASTPKNLIPPVQLPQPDNFKMRVSNSVSPKAPRTPNPSPTKGEVSIARQVSGSPLKLFGTYDTFTNQKLMRRLSQLENNMSQEGVRDDLGTSQFGEPQAESEKHKKLNEASSALSSSPRYDRHTSQNIDWFGHGDLDQFEFSESSLESNRGILETVGVQVAASPPAALPQPELKFLLESSAILETSTANQWRTRRVNTTLKEQTSHKRQQMISEDGDIYAPSSRTTSGQFEVLDTPRKRNGDIEGKRLLHSPPKIPTPKRRRTLHRTDISHAALGGQIPDLFLESHEQTRSVLGRKRKDARHGDSQGAADPQILAKRQILRPRTLTLSQRSHQVKIGGGTLNSDGLDNERIRLEQQEKIARVQAELDARAASGTSTASLTHKPMHSESRKGSVTTQDFLDEAKKIMAGIRGKALPGSGLASVEESECEHEEQFPVTPINNQDESYEESTKEPFSRPPSREGGPLPRLPQKQHDPEILNHLKKYEEMSDMDGVIASSLKSVDMAKEVIQTANNINRLVDESIGKLRSEDLNLDQAYQSDPPNIRITEYPDLQRKRKHSNSTAPISNNSIHNADFPSNGSNESSGPSTGRSVPTGSSRGSDFKHVIASHTVSHLIPEQLAGMTFDRDKHVWVKQKVVNGEKDHDEILQFEDTDDDPLGDIPDLTVDETQELSRVKAIAAQMRQEAQTLEAQMYKNHEQDLEEVVPDRLGLPIQNPMSRNAENTTITESVTLSRLVSQTTTQATQATSWDDASDVASLQPLIVHGERASESQYAGHELVEEVEQEISIDESRVEHVKYNPRRRNVTISFSSPIASIIPSDGYDGRERSNEGEASHNDSILIHHCAQRRSCSSQSRSIQYTGPRKQGLTDCRFLARPVSRIDEHDEESGLGCTEGNRPHRSVSLMLSTPLPSQMIFDNGLSAPASSLTRCNDSTFQLTPLSDFSMNQNDETLALEVSYIGQSRHRKYSNMEKRSLSLSIKDLVQRITDVEPYEPFWEHIKKIELRAKRLQTLHMLSKFCGHLQELDVSENDIGQLDGVPGTVRSLQITHNCLSDLSSWSHLRNLQYVDVSNNGLKSLDGFKNLIHLRSLRADNNMIQCLNGILNLDGLISLRLRGNMIQYVDFGECFLPHLTDLDLKGNCICEIRNVRKLHSLTTLNLEDNDIQVFNKEDSGTIWALKYLKLGGNKLEHLDITQYPNIRLLYLDRSRLGRVTGLPRAKHLDSLSLREQEEKAAIDQSFLNEALEVRKFFLSGNLLTTLQISAEFLNLQYLEVANCGLETLPHDFGQMAPNLRVINLNYNAIHDISPLLGIVRLKKLYLAGNRLARLRKSTNVLAQFPSLTRVDMRHNPLTLGFYPPPSERRVVIRDELDQERSVSVLDPFTLPNGDRESDTAYAGRLDMETRMRRRVYEMLMLGGCVRLKMLDGLLLDKAHVAARDKVWEELVKGELVSEGGSEAHMGHGEAHPLDTVGDGEDVGGDKESNPSVGERWQAEDSFA